MVRAILISAILTRNGCMVWDFIKPAGNGISVDTEVVAGDKNQSVEVNGKKDTTHNTADTIANTYQTVNEQYPWWVVALLILGWVLPSPSQMWKGMGSLLPWKRKG